MTRYDLDWMISVDDHVLEPPDVWQSRVAARYRDRAPKLVTDSRGERWVYDGREVATSGLSAVVGKASTEFSPEPMSYAEMRPGCYDARARIEDMNLDGVLASMCFPSFPRFCGQIFYEAQDKDLAHECVRAYNDWMIDDWCASAPGRFIPLIIVPLWDPALAVAEIERTAAMGARAVAFSENPAPLGLPTIHDPSGYWMPMLRAAADNELVVCMHIGSSSQLPRISPDAPVLANKAFGATRTVGAALEWLFSGIFQRVPTLKITLSEGSVGWIPFFLQTAKQVLDHHKGWAQRGVAWEYSDNEALASNGVDLNELDVWKDYREHIFGCFIDDEVGVALLDYVGADNIMIETDYPHADSTWPGSRKLAKERLGHLPEDVQYKIMRGNAERLFRFAPAQPPVVPA